MTSLINHIRQPLILLLRSLIAYLEQPAPTTPTFDLSSLEAQPTTPPLSTSRLHPLHPTRRRVPLQYLPLQTPPHKELPLTGSLSLNPHPTRLPKHRRSPPLLLPNLLQRIPPPSSPTPPRSNKQTLSQTLREHSFSSARGLENNNSRLSTPTRTTSLRSTSGLTLSIPRNSPKANKNSCHTSELSKTFSKKD
jgi:hypothetical protein